MQLIPLFICHWNIFTIILKSFCDLASIWLLMIPWLSAYLVAGIGHTMVNRHMAVLVCDENNMPHGDEAGRTKPFFSLNASRLLHCLSWPVFSHWCFLKSCGLWGFFHTACCYSLFVGDNVFFLSYCICLLHGNFSKLPEQCNFFSLLFCSATSSQLLMETR